MNEDLRRRLAFVAPERRRLVEDRLETIVEYCLLDHPTMEQTRRAAARIGVTTAGFYRLVSVWRRAGDPAVLDGAAGPRSGPRTSPHNDEGFVRTTLDELPTGRTVERDVEDVMLAAERAGRRVRGRSTLRRLITELRAEQAVRSGNCSGVLIDHAALVMPVSADGGLPVMPVATLVVDTNRRSILAIRLAIDPPSAATIPAALGRAAADGAFVRDPAPPSDLTYVRGSSRDWDELERRLSSIGIRVRGSRLSMIRGGLSGAFVIPSLLGLKTLPAIVSLPADRRRAKTKRHDQILTLKAAQEAIDERLSLSRTLERTPFSADPSLLSGLGD